MPVRRRSKQIQLSKVDRATLRSLLREDVEKTFAGLQPFIRNAKWLGDNNRYVLKTIDKIESDAKVAGVRKPRHLSQYIVASSVLHCTDGWSYLGRAMLSLLRGDPHRALHCAYYAELRAAMSLLASEGIGVFDNKHFVIDGFNSVTALRTGSGTHRFVWDCLEHWGSQRISGALFAKIVAPYARELDDWLQPLGGASVVAPQAKKWLLQWGMDLRMPRRDRDARNESSYRPDGIPSTWQLDPNDALTFVEDVWRILEPSAGSPFDKIDRHILRLSLESVFRGRHGVEPSEDRDGYAQLIAGVLERQALSPELKASLDHFLRRDGRSPDPKIFTLSREPPKEGGDSHASIVARALLLLRIASGSSAQLVRAAGFSGASIAFWWEVIGRGRGLWDGSRDPGDLIDLWADIASSLDDISSFRRVVERDRRTFHTIGRDLGATLVSLGSCERVAVWSMTPQN
jgi:hypothetical protein